MCFTVRLSKYEAAEHNHFYLPVSATAILDYHSAYPLSTTFFIFFKIFYPAHRCECNIDPAACAIPEAGRQPIVFTITPGSHSTARLTTLKGGQIDVTINDASEKEQLSECDIDPAACAIPEAGRQIIKSS